MRIPLMAALAWGCAACGAAPVRPPADVPAENPAQFACGAAQDGDFEGAGEERLRRYLAWLVRKHGAPTGLGVEQVSLAIVRGAVKPGPAGVQAGEISCTADRYRIAVYRDALSGRPLSVAYDTVAHEFHHVVQIRRDGLECRSPPGQRHRYEREAAAFAADVVPPCKRQVPRKAPD